MRRARKLVALALTLVCLGSASSALGAVTQGEIDQAVAAGGAWLRAQQAQSGVLKGFNGDWATTTLAAAGINAADVRGEGTLRSLQDYWQMAYSEAEWGELPSRVGPGQIGKAVLIGWSAGLQPTRISSEVNLAADLASIYNPETGAYGGTKNTNALGFGLLAIPYLGFPAGITARATQIVFENQHTDGGWTFEEGGSTPGDIDMTGAALAMVCSNGYGPVDPRVAKGLQFLRGLENGTTGALEGHTPGVPTINAPSIAWALIGIQACGEDPQGANWTVGAGTPGETNPVEYALHEFEITSSPQAGAMRYEPSSTPTDSHNVNATEALARALAGKLFSADPPPREDPSLPAVRPAPSVPAGTTVPIALTIEGGGGPARMCAVRVASGTPLVDALRAAETSSVPAGCVTGLQTQGGYVSSLDGAAPTNPAGGWVFSTPGAAEQRAGSQPVGFGDVVRLRLSNESLPPAAVQGGGGWGGTAQPTTPGGAQPRPARVKLAHPTIRVGRGGTVVLANVFCPAAGPCTLRAPARIALKIGKHRFLARVLSPRRVAAGAQAKLRLKLPPAAIHALRAHPTKIALKLHIASPAGPVTRNLSARLR